MRDEVATVAGHAFFRPLTLPRLCRGSLPLPQGERGLEPALNPYPSPLVGEGGTRAIAWEGEGSNEGIEGKFEGAT